MQIDKNIAFFLLMLSFVSCGNRSRQDAGDPVYPLLMQVAELNASGDKSAALLLADSALSLHPADTTLCWLLSEKAVALTDMGRMVDAIKTGHEALHTAERIEDVEATLNMRGALGIAYRRLGKLDSALIEYKAGIEYAVEQKNSEYEIYLNNCISVLYSEEKRFDEALAYARKAEKSALEANDTIERLSARANVGGIYLKSKAYRKALDAVLPLWNEVRKANYNVLTLKYLSVILKSYVALGDDKRLEQYMACADEVMRGVSLTSNGVLGIVEVKADWLGRRGNYQQQLVLLDSLLTTNATNRAMPQERLLSEKALCLSRLNRKEEAFNLMSLAYQTLDSLKQSELEKNMSEFTVKYQTLEKEMSLEQVKREKLELSNRLLWLGILVVFLMVVICILLYRRKVARQLAELQERRSYILGLEAERERMAKELHDGVCNDIFAVTLLLATDREKAETQLRSIWKEVRHLSHALLPPRFGKVSLAEAVRGYVQMLDDDIEDKVELRIDEGVDWGRLSSRQAYETYRIIQEVAANAIKHGGASSLQISMEAKDGCVSVTVLNETDAPEAVSVNGDGIGMETIERRANSIGGKLTVTRGQGQHMVNLTYKIE